MDNLISIKNVFAIGFRCNTDEFLDQYLNIRYYSSPFSFMVIDIKTALSFIDNKFSNYIDKDFILPGTTTNSFNRRYWVSKYIHTSRKGGYFIGCRQSLSMESS